VAIRKVSFTKETPTALGIESGIRSVRKIEHPAKFHGEHMARARSAHLLGLISIDRADNTPGVAGCAKEMYTLVLFCQPQL
jgi:hypothetical protein